MLLYSCQSTLTISECKFPIKVDHNVLIFLMCLYHKMYVKNTNPLMFKRFIF